MARAVTGDTVTVAPTNNIYTVLSLIGVIAVAMSLVILFVRAGTLGISLLKF
jgi:hypothetical protein